MAFLDFETHWKVLDLCQRYVETFDAWSDWRDKLAEEMYEQWRASRH